MIRSRLLLCIFASMVCVSTAHAQETGPSDPESKVQDRVSPDQQKQETEAELDALRRAMEAADARRAELTAEIAALDKDRASINRALIVTADRMKEFEDKIVASERRLALLEAERTALQEILSGKTGLLAQVLGALQRMGRNPPPAILVRPSDALKSVRSAVLLGAVVPEIRKETDLLLSQLQDLSRISASIAGERKELTASLNKLAEDETRLSLLQEKKTTTVQRSREELNREQKKAEEFASRATSLEDLIGQLEGRIEAANEAARKAREADARRAAAEKARLEAARKAIAEGRVPQAPKTREERAAVLDPAFGDNARTEPAISFANARKLLPKPVSGEEIVAFGQEDARGKASPNMAFAVRPGALVRSPADGWVVYAGPFRSYGQIVILNVGDDYRIVLSGLASVDIRPGQFVLTGEPIGRMGQTRVASARPLDLSSAQPVLYVEFRKDKKPIDPSPWWAAAKEKGSTNDS